MNFNPSLRLGVLLALAASGCHAEAPNTDEAKTVLSDGTIAALESNQMSIAEKASAVLSDELNIPISTITVDSVRAVDWRDSSIGCPQPGQAYAQVITPGHKITLRAEGRIYVIHESGGKAFMCKRQKAKSENARTVDFVWGPMAAEARTQLANQLGVDETKIIIANARKQTWFDTSIGCAIEGIEYSDARIDGYVLTLRHGTRNYTFHTDLQKVLPCPPFSSN